MPRALAPGRVNLIGEHTDYNGGFVLPAAIALRTRVDLTLRRDRAVRLWSEGFAPVEYLAGEERPSRDWADYLRGVTWALRRAGHDVPGFDAHVRSEVPSGAGLGSSAALEVAVLRALRDALRLDIDDLALALLAHRAEVEFVGARVGTMDQIASSLARDGEALLIDARSLAIERVPLPPTLSLVLVDSGIAHAHAGGGYNERRAECEEAARALGLTALRDATEEDVERLEPTHPTLAKRARHVVREDARVLELVAALRAGDLAACGRLVDASHASLRDDFEVSLPEIDLLAASLRERGGVFGARLVGGGFGGAVLALASPERAATAAAAAAEAYRERTGRPARVLVAQGAHSQA